MELASQVAIALPAGSSIQDAVDAANDCRRISRTSWVIFSWQCVTLRHMVRHRWCGQVAARWLQGLLGVPAAQGRPPEVQAVTAFRAGEQQGSSGNESGWSSTGASRQPPEPSSSAGDGRARHHAKRHSSGSRSNKDRDGAWSGQCRKAAESSLRIPNSGFNNPLEFVDGEALCSMEWSSPEKFRQRIMFSWKAWQSSLLCQQGGPQKRLVLCYENYLRAYIRP